MTTIAVTTLILTVFTAEIAAICVLIAYDGETKKSREAADWQRIKGMFAEERDELTEERTITEKAAAEVLAIVAEARSGGRHQATGLSTMERVSAAVEARSTIGARAVRVWTGGDTTQEMRLEFDRLVGVEYAVATTAIVPDPTQFADMAWRCDSCLIGRDGEKPHQSCQGCSCHCGDNQGAQIIPIGDRSRLEQRRAA